MKRPRCWVDIPRCGGVMALLVVTRGTARPLPMTTWGTTLLFVTDREMAFSPGTEGDTTPSDE